METFVLTPTSKLFLGGVLVKCLSEFAIETSIVSIASTCPTETIEYETTKIQTSTGTITVELEKGDVDTIEMFKPGNFFVDLELQVDDTPRSKVVLIPNITITARTQAYSTSSIMILAATFNGGVVTYSNLPDPPLTVTNKKEGEDD